jgi:4-amino-4-deoxy-L-arabinose transferase-like glycosyltransferase
MTFAQQLERRALPIALLVAALGAALRLDGVFSLWLHADEGIYYVIAHEPLERAQAALAGNAHPPLYYWLLRAIAGLGGDWTALRLPALVCGTAAIVAMYGFAAAAAGRIAGLLAALALALSPGAIMLSQVARPYMAQLLLLLVALRGLWRFLETRARGPLAMYAAALSTALLVHYATLIALGGIALLLLGLGLARRLPRRDLTALALAHAPLALAAGWLFVSHIRRRLLGSALQEQAVRGWLREQFADDPGGLWRSLIGVFEYLAAPWLGAIAALVFLAALAWCARRRPLLAGLGAGVLACALTLAALGLYPLGASRHSLHLAAVLLPVAAAALAAGWRLSLPLALALGAGALLHTPLERALGVPAERSPLLPETFIPTAEVQTVVPLLEHAAGQPGALLLDTHTFYLLAPVLRAARADEAEIGPIRHFRWGAREVFVSPAWTLEAGPLGVDDRTHLAWLLRNVPKARPDLAPSLQGDVRAVSAGVRAGAAARVPNQIGAIAQLTRRPLAFDELVPGANFALFRLDAAGYLAAIAELPPLK